MQNTLDEFPYTKVHEWLRRGEIVPFVGSGASRLVGTPRPLPAGRELAGELAAMMEAGFPGPPDAALAAVAQYFESVVFDREALRDHVEDRFFRQQQGIHLPENSVASCLASVDRPLGTPMFVITTNYDTFIEDAFRKAGRPVCVVTQNMRDESDGATTLMIVDHEGVETQAPTRDWQWDDGSYPSTTAFVLKMHGSAQPFERNPQDNVILTEDDYVEFMLNTGGGFQALFPPPALVNQYKRRRFLFLGYSLQDWNLRVFLRLLSRRHAISRADRLRHFSVQHGVDRYETELWGRRNVTVYDGQLDDFCARIGALPS